MARLRIRSKKAKDEAAPRLPMTPEERRRRVFQRAIKLLSAKSRSIAELRELLMQGRGASKVDVEEVLARLTEYGYLDDERYAVSYAAAKVRLRPVGRRRLKQELALKQIPKETVEQALDQVFDETAESELIDRAIEKRVRLRGQPTNRDEAKKLFEHLLRQGFPFELVSEKVRAIAQRGIEDEELG
jgi:regulatory protein